VVCDTHLPAKLVNQIWTKNADGSCEINRSAILDLVVVATEDLIKR